MTGGKEAPEAQARSAADVDGDDDGRLHETRPAEQVAEARASEA